MNGAIPPLPNIPSWRGAQFKKAQGQLYLYFLPLTILGEEYTLPRPSLCNFLQSPVISSFLGSNSLKKEKVRIHKHTLVGTFKMLSRPVHPEYLKLLVLAKTKKRSRYEKQKAENKRKYAHQCPLHVSRKYSSRFCIPQ
jgi:hypothetical protein